MLQLSDLGREVYHQLNSGARRATISEGHGQSIHAASMKPFEECQRAATPGCEGPFSFGMVWAVVGLLMGEGVRAVEVGLVPGVT